MNNKILVLPVVLVFCLLAVVVAYGGFGPSMKIFERSFSDSGGLYCVEETDGGVNFDEKGTVFYAVNRTDDELVDYCVNGYDIAESYCRDGKYPTYEFRDCYEMGFTGCSNGACTYNESGSWCMDTDGGLNYFLRGTVYGVSNQSINYSFTDKCNSHLLLQEYYCTGGAPEYVLQDCTRLGDYVCKSGECVEDLANETFCKETDEGFDLDLKGITFGRNGPINYSYEDYCINGEKLTEYVCYGDFYVEYQPSCKYYGYDGCRNGACYYNYNGSSNLTNIIKYPYNGSNQTF